MSKNNLDIQNEKELMKKLQEKGIFKNEVECLKCKNQINNLVIRNQNKGGNDIQIAYIQIIQISERKFIFHII